MKLPRVQKDQLEPGKMYIWSTPDGEPRVVWVNNDDPNTIDEWGDCWERARLKGKFYGPVELED